MMAEAPEHFLEEIPTVAATENIALLCDLAQIRKSEPKPHEVDEQVKTDSIKLSETSNGEGENNAATQKCRSSKTIPE